MHEFCKINYTQGNELLKDVINIFPQAASIPDSNGDLPLFLGLKAGKRWNSGIREIFQAAPDSNIVQDLETHLFPFMIAASNNNDNNRRKYKKCSLTEQHKTKLCIKNQESLSQLTTVFKLLREAPFQVQGGIQMKRQ